MGIWTGTAETKSVNSIISTSNKITAYQSGKGFVWGNNEFEYEFAKFVFGNKE